MNSIYPISSSRCLQPLKSLALASLAIMLLLLTACAGQPSVEPEPQASAASSAEQEPAHRPFDLQTLYSLLVADIAAQRNRYDVALRNYLRQAAQTNDAGIARHATMLAELLRAEAVALRASELWAKAAPGNADALRSAAIHQARAKDLDRAIAHMTGALELGGKTGFAELASAATGLTHARKQEVLQNLNSLIERHPDNAELWLARATLEDDLGKVDEALLSVRQSSTLGGGQTERESISAVILESQLLEKLNRMDDAVATLESALQQHQDSKRLHLQYARLLTRTDMARAQTEFEALAGKYKDDYELQFTLALVYRENQQLEKAEELLAGLLAVDESNASVHYYAGLVAEDMGDDDKALEHYAQVGPGRVFVAAKARYAELLSQRDEMGAALAHLDELAGHHSEHAVDLRLLGSNILTSHGHLEQSHQLLSAALQQHPDDQDLLYARSMLNEKRQDLNAAESDLRQLLSLDPNNAAALNALGYTLTVHTKRHDEALALIEKAFAIKPDDPAIIDSMGWVHFQLGHLDTALKYLQKAHELFPDPEVAAHYGEALWAAGQQSEAREVWRNALKAAPDSSFLKDIVERFGEP